MSNSVSANNNQQESYDPQEHLIMLTTTNGSKEHYPIHWRLHEFRLRYPLGILQAEILHLDVERNLVVVRVMAFSDGLDNCRGVGLHTGRLTLLDQVTQHAKAQALIDLGIGCAWPVFCTMDDEEDPCTTSPTDNRQPNEQSNRQGDIMLSEGLVHRPMRTAETVKAFFAKVQRIPVAEQERKWEAFKANVLHANIPDAQLIEEQIHKLNAVVSQQYQRKSSGMHQSVAGSKRS